MSLAQGGQFSVITTPFYWSIFGYHNQSLAGQVEYWAKLGRVADENADLPVSLIKEILIARAQVKNGLKTPYVFGEG